jgi:hypothetical protein
MKLKAILFSAFMLSSLIMLAQPVWSSDLYQYGELYPGYIIDAAGKKTEGFIKYTDRVSLQTDILFYPDKNDKKTKIKYSAEDLTEYMMADKVYHVIHYSGGLFTKPLNGNLLVADGCIKQYMHYKKETDPVTKSPTEAQTEYEARLYPSTVIFKKDGNDEVKSSADMGIGFAKDMPAWIEDQPELAEKVANKEKGYGFLQMHAVIDEYNANCVK